jgi:hypothetical protein
MHFLTSIRVQLENVRRKKRKVKFSEENIADSTYDARFLRHMTLPDIFLWHDTSPKTLHYNSMTAQTVS